VRAFAQAPSAEPNTCGNGSTFSFGVIAAMLVCTAAFLGIGAPAASAAEAQPGWVLQGSFGEVSDGFTLTRSPLAVDGSGNIFGAYEDQGVARAYRPDGSFLGEYALSSLVKDLAIDTGDDTIYTDEIFGGPVTRFLSDGAPTPTYTADPSFSVPAGADLVVDQSTHDLLVADPEAQALRRYDTTGALVATISTPGVSPAWIAAAPDGSFYVAPEAGPDITHFSGSGTALGTIAGVGAPEGFAFEPTNGLLVVSVGGKLKTYSSSGQFLSEVPAVGATRLASGGSDLLYGLSGRSINAYGLEIVPGVDVPAASDVAVHLSAEVDPGEAGPGEPPEGSVAHFEYSSDGGKTWTSTPEEALGGPTTIEADLTGLAPNGDYLVRAVASNAKLTNTTSNVSFHTTAVAPEVEIGSTSDVGETAVVLYATINPWGLLTTYHFEYGPTTAYGSRVPANIEAPAGDGRVARSFGRWLMDLAPGTTYHFRLVATNSVGTSYSADQTFTTHSAGSAGRGYEQVSPVRKTSAIDYAYGFETKADGSAVTYVTRSGVAGSPLFSRAFSRRNPLDWEGGIDLDPPVDTPGGITITSQLTLAVSDDFTHTFVVSNRALAPGATAGDTNLYWVDIASGDYTYVGGAGPEAFNSFAGLEQWDKFMAGAPDLSWMVFRSTVPLLPSAPQEALYRWSTADGLEVVSVLPDESPVPINVHGGYSPPTRTVSADGSRIFFWTLQGSEVGVFVREGDETKAISVSHVPGEPATPQPGQLEGVSADGRYAFISSFGPKLTSDAPGEYGDLYRWDANDESLEYLGDGIEPGGAGGLAMSTDGSAIYYASPSGVKLWRNGQIHDVSDLMLESGGGMASPSGRYFAFKSPVSGLESGSEESKEFKPVLLYDAETEEVSCASCKADGAVLGGYMQSGFERTVSNTVPRVLTDSGQVFFTTRFAVVARDTNGTRDVYEFHEGQVNLITPGDAPYNAFFLGASESGDDVFFSTDQGLVGRDTDETLDIYDARIGGGLASQGASPKRECLASDCSPPPSGEPVPRLGGSETLDGRGNPKPAPHKKCRKGKHTKKVKGKVRCVKAHKKHRANAGGKGGNR
jgi:hypothetical protein